MKFPSFWKVSATQERAKTCVSESWKWCFMSSKSLWKQPVSRGFWHNETGTWNLLRELRTLIWLQHTTRKVNFNMRNFILTHSYPTRTPKYIFLQFCLFSFHEISPIFHKINVQLCLIYIEYKEDHINMYQTFIFIFDL